jgi:ribosomal protein S21
MSISVTRKDEREANENIIRRFNRRVLQSGVVATVKTKQRFEKPISKVERRRKAIIRKARNDEKALQIKLGLLPPRGTSR